ncbi:MAG: DNA polymerase ligase N-terminal domain-containing protein [Chloroflexota bacterium]
MGLEEYKEKRDFGGTPEPAGEVKDTGLSRFVVQRHQASHLHYDFRLEMDGVLKSWAVPKGPPEAPKIRRLAVQTEDHPVDYIGFAGVIPEGYGAGTVEIWDRGDYQLTERREDRYEFTLNGERLHGPYILLRTGDRNWLLMKRKAEGS